MKRINIIVVSILIILLVNSLCMAETVDVLIKGIDDGIKHSKQQDYREAVMNAKLQAIERAGVEIKSITKVVNFKLKYDMVESKAKAVLLPGFQIMDIGYQQDGTYQVALSGKVKTGKDENNKWAWLAINGPFHDNDSRGFKYLKAIIDDTELPVPQDLSVLSKSCGALLFRIPTGRHRFRIISDRKPDFDGYRYLEEDQVFNVTYYGPNNFYKDGVRASSQKGIEYGVSSSYKGFIKKNIENNGEIVEIK